jgi:murein DD-endopeptidase MepM/ murein hydrolase activator NlpD
MDRQEIPDQISDQFIRAFSSKVNFSRELNHQSDFEMFYEQGFINGNPVTIGKLLEAHINLSRKSYDAYLWTNAEGKSTYYSGTGEALDAFNLKSPLAFVRKTSNFGLRIDPFNRQWANHQGIDLGAAPGTEVFATANGKVKFAGKQGAYGNLVILEHANGYETYYGHLSNFSRNIEVNQHIKQGSVIAYVGSSGKATAPHLHYELRKLSVPMDPEQSFQSASQTKLQGEELVAFEKAIRGSSVQKIAKINSQSR